MDWETPTFIEIDMSAEIGGYQGEEDRPEWPPVVEPASPASDDDA